MISSSIAATFLGVISGALHLYGYLAHYRESMARRVRPNPAAWAMWAFGSLVNLWSYAELTDGGWAKEILPICCASACIVLFAVYRIKGRLRKLTGLEVVVLSLDVVITIFYILSNNSIVTNIALQISTVLSFQPVFRDLKTDPGSEQPRPWMFWTSAYAMQLGVLAFEWSSWIEAVYPLVNLLLNGSVLIICVRATRQASSAELVTIRPSSINGCGLFACRSLHPGEHIICLEGRDHRLSDEESIKPKYDNWFGVGMRLFIEPENELMFINHSCDPNAGFNDDYALVVMRKIEAGEEITFDYSICERVTQWSMRCSCGQPNCRQVVSSIQSLPLTTYKRYEPHIPKFFREVYAPPILATHETRSVSVVPSRHGRGIVAARLIAPGEVILVFSGPLLSTSDALRSGDGDWHIQVGADLFLNTEEPGRFTNHSCNPNAGIRDDVVLVALRLIEAGEEICFDYSTTISENGTWRMVCHCGANKCRGVIGDFDQLPEELRASYLSMQVVQRFIRIQHLRDDPTTLGCREVQPTP